MVYLDKKYVDRKGRALTSDEFFALTEDPEYVIVEETFLGDKQVRVSTTWLGYASAPFETMVFGGPRDGYSERYLTIQEAKERHEVVVKLVETDKQGFNKFEEDNNG